LKVEQVNAKLGIAIEGGKFLHPMCGWRVARERGRRASGRAGG
jgi:hypothetical protein